MVSVLALYSDDLSSNPAGFSLLGGIFFQPDMVQSRKLEFVLVQFKRNCGF